MRCLYCIALACALAGQTPAGPGGDDSPKARRLLMRVIRAAGNARYTGRRVVEVKRGPSLQRHEEFVIRDKRRTRIEFPPGSPLAGQVIVENERERRHYLPGRNEIRVLPPRFSEVSRRLVRLIKGPRKQQFALSIGPGESVAGVRASQVVVADRSGNVAQRLYIHPASGVLLKRRLYDDVGTQVGYFEFTQIDLTPRIPADAFVIRRRGAKVITPLDYLRRITRERGFEPLWLPPSTGYRLEWSQVRRLPGGPGLYQSYQSLRGRLTLYQLKTAVDPQRLRRHTRGRARTYSWQRNGRTFVLISQLDDQALRALASQLRDAG